MRDIKRYRFLNNMKRVGPEYLGAIDGCLPFLCKCVGVSKLSDIFLEENDYKYDWKSISMAEAENIKIAVIMYIKRIHIDDYMYSSLNFFKGFGSDSVFSLRAHICGIGIQDIIFLKDKYNTIEGEIDDLKVSDHYEINNYGCIEGIDVEGSFNIRNCMYYHLLE